MVDRPGVTSTFQDFTTFINPAGLSSISLAGAFTKGVMDTIVTVSSVGELESLFGVPTPENRVSFFLAQQALITSSNVNIIRIPTSGSLNATASGTGILVKNREHYDNAYADGQASVGSWVAKTSGTWGNGLRVSLCPANSTAFQAWDYKTSFPKAPATSSYVGARGGSLDEMHIVVVDVTGDISGTPNTVLEKFEFVSQALDALTLDGSTNFYKNVVNNQSRYVYWLDHPSSLTDAGDLATGTTFTIVTAPITNNLSGGILNDTVTIGEYQTAYTKLINDKLRRPDIIVAPRLPDGENGITLANFLIAKAEIKKDFILCLSPPIEDTLNVDADTAETNVITFRNSLTPSKFAICDSTSVKVYDKYNGGVNVSIPGSGNLATTLAYTWSTADVASSPAGTKRGQYFNIVSLNYDPDEDAQGKLVSAGINPVITGLGSGAFLYCDKTLLDRNSAFDAVSVVTTFIYLNRAISQYAETYLFEKNDSITDIMFRTDVSTFLQNQISNRLISSQSVTKGNSTNPTEYIANITIGTISPIRYIKLNYIAVKGQQLNVNVSEGIA